MNLSIACAGFVLAAALVPYPTALPELPPSFGERSRGHLDDDSLANDPDVTVGTLSNGLRYYIRANKRPEHRTELRLVVKAGSLMEDDDQRGVAHFVEHMAFRGTTHFKGTEIVEYLKSIGVGFGNDLNASTSFATTVYMLPIPNDSAAFVRSGLQILEDWAHGVAFQPKDIEDERGIILGERRYRLNADGRVFDQQFPVMAKGSRYPDRIPIGTETSLRSVTREQIIRFYEKWYRPDRMAIIAVGDFDPREMERMIRKQFSAIPAPEAPLADPDYPIPAQPGTALSFVRDPELTATSVSVQYKVPGFAMNTKGAERAEIARGLFDAMLNDRLQEVVDAPNAPFLEATVRHGDFLTRRAGAVSLDATVAGDGVSRGLDAILTEVARVAQHGFTQAELDRAKEQYLSRVEHAEHNRGDENSDVFTMPLIHHFLDGVVFQSISASADLAHELVPAITLDSVNAMADFVRQTDNRVILVSQAGSARSVVPDSAALVAMLDAVVARPVAAYVEHLDDGNLLRNLPAPGKIVAEKRHSSIGVTEWTLSNGITVFLKPTKFKNDDIFIQALSPGGTSLLTETDYPSALVLNEVAGVGGLGTFTRANLGKRLSGKVVELSAQVSALNESVNAFTTWKDAESAFQLLALAMTSPRFDSAAAISMLQRAKISVANRSADPEQLFSDTVAKAMYGHSKRIPLVSSALFDKIDSRRAFELYRARFKNAGDFQFMIVGAFAVDSMRSLVERYVATLPTTRQRDRVRDFRELHVTRIPIKKVVAAGRDQKTTTYLQFISDFQSTPESRTELAVLRQLLQDRLLNRLREQLAGTYSVGVQSSVTPRPGNECLIGIQFVADPARRAALTKATLAEIDSLQRVAPTEDEMRRAVEPMVRARMRARRTNEYWLQLLPLSLDGEDFDQLVDDGLLRNVTAVRIRDAARRYLKLARVQEFDLVPKAESH